MATSRFGLTNRMSSAATVKNGSGGGAPARDEDADFPMDNVLQGDRHVVWRSSASPSYPIRLDVDLGGNRTIEALGFHGMFGAWLGITAYYQTGAYSAGGTWTAMAVPSVASMPRDTGAVFAAVANVRSLRFDISGSGQIGCGKFFAGALVDLELVGSPGMENNTRLNRELVTLPSGATFAYSLGANGHEITIPVEQVSTATSSLIEQLAGQTGSFTFVDLQDVFYDVLLANDLPLRYPSPNLRNRLIRMVGLP